MLKKNCFLETFLNERIEFAIWAKKLESCYETEEKTSKF